MNLHCDRRDRQLTESVWAPDADRRASSPDGGEKKGRRREERDGAGLTRRDKAATATDQSRPLAPTLPSVQVVRVDPIRPGVTAAPLTSQRGERHVNVMM